MTDNKADLDIFQNRLQLGRSLSKDEKIQYGVLSSESTYLSDIPYLSGYWLFYLWLCGVFGLLFNLGRESEIDQPRTSRIAQRFQLPESHTS